MNLFDDDELSTKICKVGGPLILFICTPLVAWIAWQVIQKDLAAGIQIETKNLVGILGVILAEGTFGLWMCRKGYGWFGGKKPRKPEL